MHKNGSREDTDFFIKNFKFTSGNKKRLERNNKKTTKNQTNKKIVEFRSNRKIKYEVTGRKANTKEGRKRMKWRWKISNQVDSPMPI